MTKEFLLKSLLPYKNDPSLCGYNDGDCVYLTKDNKTCAIGQHMKPGPWQHKIASASTLFKSYGEKKIMTKEWLNQSIPHEVADKMQQYHDVIAYSSRFHDDRKNIINQHVDSLEKMTGFDLKELKF